ncbi:MULTISPECIES: winged helix DNA-binding domain-containing protein [unclassified Microbacterium]|uniref:winged helix DNA-binding domain-containing protein n=1 Tax=unclassified Microbacterium TaxID=2609290 RepID=UPI0012F95104|nr:winged helix DNA-binding domain-containing protein [Microbacterium sp. MAH-37]MVQ41385.1 winged helix DNA-binding domain-containing protein [Microbacterium sp. MAH-37]
MKAERSEIIAFRLAAHHLTERLDGGLLEAAAACGVQNSPPGSALLALNARVRSLTPQSLDTAVEDRSMLQTWAMRGAPFYFPIVDAEIFTAGALPTTEAALRRFILGIGPSVDELGITVTDAVDLIGRHLDGALAGRRLAIDELGKELARRTAPDLTAAQRKVWAREGPYAPGQPVGEAVAHFCLRILMLRGSVCIAPRDGDQAPFVLTEEWLGHPLPVVDAEQARAELLRRHLHCYGPSTRADFAGWLGVRAGDVGPWWEPLEGELAEVDTGRRTWMLAADLDALRAAAMPEGVRLLPPRDPYTQARDRGILVDPAHQREVWKTVGDPGTLLADGEIVGVWRPRKKGRALTLSVTPFGTLTDRILRLLQPEAEQVALLRGASTVEIVVA